MNGWLPEDFGEKEAGARAEKAVASIKKRVRRERHARTALLGLAGALLVVSGLWSPLGHKGPGVQPVVRARPLEITVQKADDGIELAWTGSAKGEYVVYRCTSPRFDVCSTAGVVRGTRWSESHSVQARVVFYKVEPRNAS